MCGVVLADLLLHPGVCGQRGVCASAELMDAAAYPVCHMVNAKGMVDEQHKNFIGTYWGQVRFWAPAATHLSPPPPPPPTPPLHGGDPPAEGAHCRGQGPGPSVAGPASGAHQRAASMRVAAVRQGWAGRGAQVSSPYCAEIVESADAYLVAGPTFNDYTTTGWTLLMTAKKARCCFHCRHLGSSCTHMLIGAVSQHKCSQRGLT